MARSEKAQGFVLKKKIILEKDYLVTVFTKERGKITAIAKGARSITSRRAAHLQTGNLINAQLSRSSQTTYIQGSELVSGFVQTRTEGKTDVLYIFLYILDKLLPEEQQEMEIYTTLTHFFIDLSKEEKKPLDLLKQHLQKTLTVLGYIEEILTLDELLSEVEKNIEEKLPRRVIM
jgi:DNA repair protein RecO (recombination protein O)